MEPVFPVPMDDTHYLGCLTLGTLLSHGLATVMLCPVWGSIAESWGSHHQALWVGPRKLPEEAHIWDTVMMLHCSGEWTQPAGLDCSGPKMP